MRSLSISNEKKWKYLSFALMGIIATGLLAPSAFAANPTLEEVLANVLSIKAKTDKLPADPASDATVNTARDAINAHTDTAIGSIPAGITQAQYQTLKCNSGIIRPHVDLSNCNLSQMILSGADLRFANLSGAIISGGTVFSGCTGTPIGISPNPCTP